MATTDPLSAYSSMATCQEALTKLVSPSPEEPSNLPDSPKRVVAVEGEVTKEKLEFLVDSGIHNWFPINLCINNSTDMDAFLEFMEGLTQTIRFNKIQLRDNENYQDPSTILNFFDILKDHGISET